MLNRRQTLLSATAALLAGGAGLGWLATRRPDAAVAQTDFEIAKSDAQWREQLGEARYAVLRQEATERPFSSDLLHEARAGRFLCAGCDLAAYSSAAKYDSGTGWPSFFQALPDAVRTKEDHSLFAARTEVHCRRCGGHFGHIFDDGPAPTGKRHCINGLALTFQPGTA